MTLKFAKKLPTLGIHYKAILDLELEPTLPKELTHHKSLSHNGNLFPLMSPTQSAFTSLLIFMLVNSYISSNEFWW